MTNALIGARNSVQACQAKRMETRSKKFIPPVAIGDFVTLSVPDVDRGLADPLNLICRIVDIDCFAIVLIY